MVRLVYTGPILMVLLGILHLASAGEESLADYSQNCLTRGDLNDRSFAASLFFTSPDEDLWRTEDNWQPKLVLNKTRIQNADRTYASDMLLVEENSTSPIYTTLNANGERLNTIEWQPEWTYVYGLTQDGRLIIVHKTGHPEDTGVSLVTFGGQITTFTDFPNALIVDESHSLFITTGFDVSPDGQLIVYDAFFEAENKLTSQRGLVLADISSKREIWRTHGNYIWGEIWSHPYWSPNGTKFAYVNQVKNYLYHEDFDVEIAMVDRSGQEHIMTDFNAAGATFRIPNSLYWSPDSTKIAFWMRDVSYEFDGSEDIPEDRLSTTLHIYDLSVNKVYNLCVDEHLSPALTWSPDGQALAYGSTDTIRLVDLEGHDYIDLPLEVKAFSNLEWLTN